VTAEPSLTLGVGTFWGRASLPVRSRDAFRSAWHKTQADKWSWLTWEVASGDDAVDDSVKSQTTEILVYRPDLSYVSTP